MLIQLFLGASAVTAAVAKALTLLKISVSVTVGRSTVAHMASGMRTPVNVNVLVTVTVGMCSTRRPVPVTAQVMAIHAMSHTVDQADLDRVYTKVLR